MTDEELNDQYAPPLAQIAAALETADAAHEATLPHNYDRTPTETDLERTARAAKVVRVLREYQTWILQQKGNRAPYDASVMRSEGMSLFLASPLVARPVVS